MVDELYGRYHIDHSPIEFYWNMRSTAATNQCLLCRKAAIHPEFPHLRPGSKQKATQALHRMAFARLSPRPVSERTVCGWRRLV
jgi:hypothetical protein